MSEKTVSLFLFSGILSYLFFANQLAFGTFISPKSGFLPILAGTLGLILTLLLLLSQWRTEKTTQQPEMDWTRFIFIIIGLIFYVTMLNMIGYLAATFIFLLYLFKISDTPQWLLPLTIAASTALTFYLLFDRFLAVTLP
jgi:putative tricarboxylic transport membrane protein